MKRILRGISTKYMLVFMALIVVTVFSLGMIINSILSNFSLELRMRELSNANRLFKSYYDFVKTDKDIELIIKETETELENILSATHLKTESCHVILTDETGNVVMLAQKNSLNDKMEKIYFSSLSDNELEGYAVTSKTISSEILSIITREKNITDTSSCNDFFTESVIWNGSLLEDKAGNIDGYVFSFSFDESQDALVTKMINSISIAIVAILIVSICAIYGVSRRLMKPLKDISEAAKSFARGKYDVRVKEKGNDELSELAVLFNKMASAIQSKDEMQRQFLSNASHDLRTPMTTIAGFIDGILDGAIPPEKHEHYLRIIKSETQRLSRLVASLLDISRLQSGERKFDMKSFNICELARQTVLSFESQFVEKNLDVEFDLEKFDINAYGDKDAINQVIYNLCHNAIKFSSRGGKYKVTIKEIGENKVFFSVFNEGIGIKKEDIPFVFDRFFKGDKSRGLDKTGVGLGLFISKTIIDAHEGDITVSSEYGKFCEFKFTLERRED